ncbi:CASP-like protein 4A3 [Mercurialis annua]|uniref:CASP-like protein 4A3 n=1 Tax=Mercurialis annua TaxID=3986 RepID=UPI0021605E5C|nr:CASP-like protein 4A3 [Mercurialis annua]
MEFKSKPRIQIPTTNMKRSSSSNSDYSHFESPHSPLRLSSPLPSDQGDLHDSPPFVSPMNSPQKSPPPVNNSMAIIAVDKFTQCTPQPSPKPPEHANGKSKAQAPPPVTVNRAVKEEGPTVMGKYKADGRSTVGVVQKPAGRSSRGEEKMKVGELGFRISEIVLCLISFSVMAADKTQGWSGDSYDRYREYRYCLSVNVIGFVYSGFQAYDLSYHLVTGKHVIRHHLRRHFTFFMDQILAYLLISASSSAATRVDDWQSNWGKDEFTEMATASVAMALLAFIAFAVSSLISGYNLYNNGST